jgi:protein disulfide-isomerase
MKSLLAAALLTCTFTLCAPAAPPAGWTDDYAQAVEKAKAENKYLLLDFTGSDWCGFCKLLDKEVFSTPQFHSWAKKYVVLVQLDFPHNTPLSDAVKAQNSGLMSKYPTRGFPTVLIVDTAGKELVRESGYHPGTGAATYIKTLETELKKSGPLPTASGTPGGPQQPSIFKTPPPPGSSL